MTQFLRRRSWPPVIAGYRYSRPLQLFIDSNHLQSLQSFHTRLKSSVNTLASLLLRLLLLLFMLLCFLLVPLLLSFMLVLLLLLLLLIFLLFLSLFIL